MKASSFLLLLLLGLSSSIEFCPDERRIRPCHCSEDDDSGSLEVGCYDEVQSLSVLKKALNSLSGKRGINLGIGYNNLGTVPSNFFYGLDILTLDIDHCELDSLSDDGRPILLGLENSLQELIITASFSEVNVPAKLKVEHLRRLKEIDLSFNTITEMGDEWFDRGPASLEYLTISNNGIDKLGNRAFANLINLKQLSLDGNRFGDIRRSMLPSPAARLEILELDNNGLTAIPEDLFSGMPSLISVSLRINGFLRLDMHTWYPVWPQLESISLEGNPIECDSTMDWIIRLRKYPVIYGKCYAPRDTKGYDVSEYLDRSIGAQ